ncbi:CAP domain-containing protein [Persicimonas caeni]|uniref:CAP domain-containing protein n=1 Tax=Persicimonas caeni TaxID=2292766 RepID=A0A4Y6PSE4_PERCE|nr:CAP domain-containing protein [Persicimonas caeni]QDG51241.1 CAP domain-containing protein [Persicimonas caeni]QED32462.1 CAP domain-containing protein [Persicimonas caeni]
MLRRLLCCVVSVGLLGVTACSDDNGGSSDKTLTADAGDGASSDASSNDGSSSDSSFSDTGVDTVSDTTSDTAPDTGPDPSGDCDPGYSSDGAGGCTPDPVSDPATRTRQEVCTRWTGYAPQAATLWAQEPTDECDWGELHPEAQGDAIRRLDLFRWLVGLDPVTTKPNYIEVTQACATTLAAEGAGLTHNIPSDYACYTQEAATGASSSNIAYGVRNPAATVDLYIGDRGVNSLGHRRWCLNPTMAATGFGQRGSYSCMYSFDRSQASSVDHVFYPSAGFFPRSALLGAWSAGSRSFNFGSSPEVTITNVSDSSIVQVNNVQKLRNGYAIDTISWEVPNAEADVEYEVTIANGSNTLSYRTTLVDCP